MSAIRVLIVDDSVVIRKMLTDVLSETEGIEVAGVAANGAIALKKIPQVNPDLLTLDIEMPEMNGLETLEALRKIYPDLPVIMFSTLTERGAVTTLEALSLGANDYVTKPANVGSVTIAIERLRSELIPKIKGLIHKPVHTEVLPSVDSKKLRHGLEATAPRIKAPPSSGARAELVALGVSTGGPNALADLFPQIPEDFPVPIVLVQHMPPVFTKYLAERLDKHAHIEIVEAQDGDVLHPGGAWMAPGGLHMVLEPCGDDVVVRLNEEPPENSCRPAVDVLFRSAAKIYKDRVLGVILTGMGNDGLRGCEDIRDARGEVIAQDEASSTVWGMPGMVTTAGLSNAVLPLSEIAPAICRRATKSLTANPSAG